ncbi:putative glycerol kinase 5 [Adelges cooleyi]|uniref:putative glycerol kinase 5 n=1 Tax=Adelges cooleyi TaxID=133065 RepID=UPI00217F6FB7|nr:putative glycerol kinase 5 [Adelges cooleyi]XP_050422320.1 putative glycerol kinase 5 [Adelges cooleyi]XP_050422321.1 putative glycerol kinase 5 [Adelges cooleyi]
MNSSSSMEYVAAIDVGTTNLKCQIFSSKFHVVGSSFLKINVLKPHHGWEEIDPEELTNSIKQSLQNALKDAGLKPCMVKNLGLSSQRNTFITWNKTTGKHYHNFITWRDTRSSLIIERFNKSLFLKAVKFVSRILSLMCSSKQIKLAKSFSFTNAQILPKLIWLLENNIDFRKDVNKNEVQFGTLDTWLLYRASKGELHVTDLSCASSTGLFNVFTMTWLPKIVFQFFGFSNNFLPTICDSNLSKHYSGAVQISNIPITCSMADQSSSLFGTGSFSKHTAKVTMGTGMFLDINCGSVPDICLGYFPLVGWMFNDEVCFTLEALDHNSGPLITLGKSIGCYSNLRELNELLLHEKKESFANDVLFVLPDSESSKNRGRNYSFINLTSNTTKADMVKSILESFAFRIKKRLDKLHKEIPGLKLNTLWVDGGVSQNDYICQAISNATSTTVIRMKNNNKTEISCLGVAFMAGLSSGVWSNKDELKDYRSTTDEKFVPEDNDYIGNECKYIRWLYSQKCLY